MIDFDALPDGGARLTFTDGPRVIEVEVDPASCLQMYQWMGDLILSRSLATQDTNPCAEIRWDDDYLLNV